MKCENEKLGCSFELPDTVTVRQQLRYWADLRVIEGEPDTITRWEAGKKLIQGWQCDAMPDPQVSLDELTGPTPALIVIWAGLEIFKHLHRLEDVPKN